MIACVDSDAENIFIALTARELRSDIFDHRAASAEDSEKKLLRAGADRVISPYKTSGAEMARVALHPQVGGAVEVADYRMEEIEVSPACEGGGQDDRRGPRRRGDRRRPAPDGRLETQPPPETVIDVGRHAGRDGHAGGARAARAACSSRRAASGDPREPSGL